MSVILNLNNVHLEYGRQAILNGINFSLQQGEIVCLLGPSGCGKTSILKAIAGLLPISLGEITLVNKTVSTANKLVAAEKRNLGMLFQDYALFPHLSVADNITYGLRGKNQKQHKARLDELLKLVHLEGQEHKFPHQLSGGQQQRVALARALAYKPNILLLDEPFSNIDNKVKFELIEHVRAIIKHENVAAIFVSHSKEEAYAFADKVAVINQGEVAQLASPEVLYHQPCSTFVAEFMGDLNLFELNDLPDATLRRLLEQNPELSDQNKIGFRPESLRLCNEETGFHADLIKQRFIGSHYTLSLQYRDKTLHAILPREYRLTESKRVYINVEPEDAIIF